jgi:hypothetical protein
VIEKIKQSQEKKELIAVLKIIAPGEKDRLQNKGLSVAESPPRSYKIEGF